jgi:hypothetical protein
VRQQIQYTTRIEDGRLPEVVRKNIARILKAWNGKVIILSIEEAKKKRTDRQNAFYWGVVLPCVMEMFRDAGSDATKEEIHVIPQDRCGRIEARSQIARRGSAGDRDVIRQIEHRGVGSVDGADTGMGGQVGNVCAAAKRVFVGDELFYVHGK